MEKDLKETDLLLLDPEKFKEISKNQDFFTEYEKKQQILKDSEKKWENLSLQLESLKG